MNNSQQTTLEWISTQQALPQITQQDGSFYKKSVDVLISWRSGYWVKAKYVCRRVRGSKNPHYRFEWNRRICPFPVKYWAQPIAPQFNNNEND